MWINHNQNPNGDNIHDCVVRAISKTLDIPYWQVFDELCEEMDRLAAAYISEPRVFIPYLNRKGYEVRDIQSKMTVKQLCAQVNYCSNCNSVRWLVLVNGHMTSLIAGDIYDTWNCHRYKVQYVIVPGEDSIVQN